MQALLNLGKEKPDDEPMYTLQKTFGSEIIHGNPHVSGMKGWHLGRRYLLRLNTKKYTPY